MFVKHLCKLETGGVLSTENSNFRMVVQERSGMVLFLLMRHSKGSSRHPSAIVASKIKDSVKGAMADPQKMVARFMAGCSPGEHDPHDTRSGVTLPIRDSDVERTADTHGALGMSQQ